MSKLAERPAEAEVVRRERRRSAVAVAVSMAILASFLYAGYTVASGFLHRFRADTTAVEDFVGPGRGEVVFEVRRGETAGAVGARLARAGVVKSAAAFSQAAQADAEAAGGLQPGFYRLQREMSGAQAFALLLDPTSRAETKVTVPEGLRLEETLAALSKGTGIKQGEFRKVLAGKPAGESYGLPDYAGGRPEGFLFPATYALAPGATAVDVLKQMTGRYAEAAKKTKVSDSRRFSAYETVVIASLVEAEAKLDPDFGKVARVIHNRVRQGMALELDSTVNYVLKTSKQAPTLKDIEVDDPYNTYENPGLPPGPINSPGERALAVAADPPPGDWLYFVTTDPDSGETKFTSSYNEFLQFKREYQRNAATN